MESKNYICGGNKFAYSKGYIGLPVVVNNLPETIEVNEATLLRKTSFHVSLICVKDILDKKPDAEQVILNDFCEFTKENDISFFQYTGEFRFAEHEDRKTLVALCEVSNLKGFSEMLSAKLGVEIPAQPTHVTLFTLQPDMGIGLNTPEDMESKSIRVDVSLEVGRSLNI